MAIIAATTLSSCTTATKPDVVKQTIPSNAAFANEKPDFIQVIPYFFHAPDETLKEMVDEVHTSTNLDCIVTDRAPTDQPLGSRVAPYNHSIVAYTKSQTEQLLESELDAYKDLIAAHLGFILSYEKLTNSRYLNDRATSELRKVAKPISLTNAREITQANILTLKQIAKEKEARAEHIVDKVVRSTQYANNIGVVIHANSVAQVTDLLTDVYRVSVIAPYGSEKNLFNLRYHQATYEVQIERHKTISKKLEGVIAKNPDLREAYQRYINDGELPSVIPDIKPLPKLQLGPMRENSTRI